MDLVQDFIDVVTSMCARIYGKRSADNRVQRVKKILTDKDPEDARARANTND